MSRQRGVFVFYLSRLARFVVGFLLFLSISLPTAFSEIKGGGILFAIVLVLICNNLGIFRVARAIVISCILFSALGVFWSVYGVINGNPGAIRVLTVMALYPIVFMMLIQVYREGDGLRFFCIFGVSALVICFGDLAFIYLSIYFPGSIVEVFYQHLYKDWAVVDHENGYIKFTLPNVASLLFILPFFIAAFLVKYSSIRIFWLVVIICLCFSVALLSARRALLLMIFVGPFMAYLLTLRFSDFSVIYNTHTVYCRFFLMAFLVSIGVLLYYANNDYLINVIGSTFDFEDNQSNIERVYQFDALLSGIEDAPFFGQGAGAVAGYIRSDEMPWAYELFYLSLIFQYGLVGFFAYFFGVLFLIFFLIAKVRKKGRSSFEFCYLAGLLAFLLASASNPYLAKFDYMWIVFIPLAIVNSDFVGKRLGSRGATNAC